ncbi:unnamed protein product, partial [Cyprideis torosa]
MDVEMDLHVRMCDRWGLAAVDLERVPEKTQTIAYTRFVLDAGNAGDLLDLYVALAPCMIGYGEIGARLAPEQGDDNPYAEWINDYDDTGALSTTQASVQRRCPFGSRLLANGFGFNEGSSGSPDRQGVKQALAHVALVVGDYDKAIDFDFDCGKLKFDLLEDTEQPEQKKRWVVVRPPGSGGTSILLARASKPEQELFVGNQSGGRVFLFLATDDFWRDYEAMKDKGIIFTRDPKTL